MSELITVSHLDKNYDSFRLRDVSFSLPGGSIMGLIGENGAGKTTVLKLILNELRRDGGSVAVFGQDNGKRTVREELGVVFDECCFWGDLRPDDMEKILKAAYRSWDSAYYARCLERFSLPRKKCLKDFSRGMKMKLQIAGALAHHPRLLLLDEATSGLDPVARSEILDLLLEFIGDEEHGVLLSTHITSDLERAADYITFLSHGELIFSRSKDDLLEQYGILKCGTEELDKLRGQNALRIRKNKFGAEVLIADREEARRRWPGALIERAALEDIMVFYERGETA